MHERSSRQPANFTFPLRHMHRVQHRPSDYRENCHVQRFPLPAKGISTYHRSLYFKETLIQIRLFIGGKVQCTRISKRRRIRFKNSSIFWYITPRSPLKVNRRYGETCCIHLQGRINRTRNKREIRWQAGFLLGLFFDPKDSGDMLLRNIGWLFQRTTRHVY
jgi:hypothetical protein